ncbi:DNA translocase FtsK 4TM domain-containing protein [Oligella ureolytica]
MFLMAGMVFLGFSLFFNFSWLTITEQIGSAIAGVFVSFDKFQWQNLKSRIGETAQEEMAEQITAHKEQLPPSKSCLKISEPAIKELPVSEKAVAAKQVKLFEAGKDRRGTKIVLSGDIRLDD